MVDPEHGTRTRVMRGRKSIGGAGRPGQAAVFSSPRSAPREIVQACGARGRSRAWSARIGCGCGAEFTKIGGVLAIWSVDHVIKDCQIAPGRVKIGLGTNQFSPYLTSV